MLGIPRRYSHFAFAVIQSGLTRFVAAGIASLPSLVLGSFLHNLAVILVDCLGDNVADRCSGRASD